MKNARKKKKKEKLTQKNGDNEKLKLKDRRALMDGWMYDDSSRE